MFIFMMFNREKSLLQFRMEPSLHHSEAGAISISSDGTELCLTLAPAAWMDDAYRVVGKVVSGMDVLDRASQISTGADDVPLKVQ